MQNLPVTPGRLVILSLLFIASAAAESLRVNPGPPPIEQLFQSPHLAGARLAPDGRSLAGLNHEADGATHLALLDFGRGGATILKGTDQLKIYSFAWLNDRSILIQSVRDRMFVDGLYVVDRDDFRRVQPLSLGRNYVILGRPKARPKHVMLWRPRGEHDLSNDIDLFEISADDILRHRDGYDESNRIRVRYPEPDKDQGAVLGYATDVVGELAVCDVYHEGKRRALLFDSTDRIWRSLPFDAESTGILAVEPDHQHIWISEHVPGTGFQVCRYSVTTQERGPVILTDPLFNPASGHAHYSLVRNTLVGISYYQRRLTHSWFHPDHAGMQRAVDRLLPHTDNRIVDTDTDEKLFLFYSTGAQIPGAYFLFDIEQGRLTPIAQTHPWLSQFDFAPTRSIKFTARDGLELEGYLTLPPEASPQNKVPLVVLCHDGPAARATWDFDVETQFFVSRGYAVLQPNYRGSSGYKPAISKDGELDFRRMHEDITDATKAFRKLELIDPGRIAILGTGFGGYLAMAGAAFEGDLYRCALTTSGIFDWEQLTKDAKWAGRPGEYQLLKDKLGQPGRDRQHFARISPMAAVDDIRIPVFISHGRSDYAANLDQSMRLASQLKRRKVTVETFFPKHEFRGFRSTENRTEYYTRIEAFLGKHLR